MIGVGVIVLAESGIVRLMPRFRHRCPDIGRHSDRVQGAIPEGIVFICIDKSARVTIAPLSSNDFEYGSNLGLLPPIILLVIAFRLILVILQRRRQHHSVLLKWLIVLVEHRQVRSASEITEQRPWDLGVHLISMFDPIPAILLRHIANPLTVADSGCLLTREKHRLALGLPVCHHLILFQRALSPRQIAVGGTYR